MLVWNVFSVVISRSEGRSSPYQVECVAATESRAHQPVRAVSPALQSDVEPTSMGARLPNQFACYFLLDPALKQSLDGAVYVSDTQGASVQPHHVVDRPENSDRPSSKNVRISHVACCH